MIVVVDLFVFVLLFVYMWLFGLVGLLACILAVVFASYLVCWLFIWFLFVRRLVWLFDFLLSCPFTSFSATAGPNGDLDSQGAPRLDSPTSFLFCFA